MIDAAFEPMTPTNCMKDEICSLMCALMTFSLAGKRKKWCTPEDIVHIPGDKRTDRTIVPNLQVYRTDLCQLDVSV